MSYYAKYRPQTIAELDLDSVRAELTKILTSGEFSHAYLFSGPKGTGKTSSARILAKVLNCEQNQGGKLHEPCNACVNCKAITRGSSLSVTEMDAASNRGIDDIRELKERIALSPADGAYAVYVVDEVHMLTTEAFNALLKTLEEPPKHAVFVLCTTEAHKLPETVVSRCTRVPFHKATVSEVVRSLSKAVAGERLTAEAGVLEAIAARVDGSFRDGMKILEQLAGGSKTISLESVDAATGYSDDYRVEQLLQALAGRDVRAALAELAVKEQAGVDFGVLGKRLVEKLREKLLEAVTQKNELTNLRINEYRELIELFAKAVLQIKMAAVAQLPLEVAIVAWCEGLDNGPVASSKQQVVREEQPAAPVTPSPKKVGAVSVEHILSKWGEILKAVKPHNHSLEALLRAARPTAVEADRLTVEVFYAFHKEQLEQERHRKIIEAEINALLGSSLFIEFVLGKKAAPQRVPAGEPNVTGAVADEALAAAAEEIFG